MAKHSKIGIKGEEIAAAYLLNKGYIILHRNWRTGRKEVDIIAVKGDTLVMAEVKTRTNFDFGFPEESVGAKKQAYLKAAAEAFIYANPQYLNLRFDIISILMDSGAVKEILHFEEAFY